jgi:predicted AAA+ superfamily ATPase
MNALAHRTFDDTRRKPDLWGRIVESAVGAALYNGSRGQGISLHYWAASNRELDFVLTKGDDVLAIEVKSNFQKSSLPGITAFSKAFPRFRKLLVGGQGMDLETFFNLQIQSLF